MTTAVATATRTPTGAALQVHAGAREPRFAPRSLARAHLRALALVALVAALTYGFLSQVWSSPSGRDLETHACNPSTERCA